MKNGIALGWTAASTVAEKCLLLAHAEKIFAGTKSQFKGVAAKELGYPIASINRYLRIGRMLQQDAEMFAAARVARTGMRLLTDASAKNLSRETRFQLAGLKTLGEAQKKIVEEPRKTAMVEKLRFGPAEMSVVKSDNGDYYVPMRTVCSALGTEVTSQARRVGKTAWGKDSLIELGAAGVHIKLSRFPMWMATINSTDVANDDVLEDYQTRVVDTILETFRTPLPENDRLQRLENKVEQVANILSHIESEMKSIRLPEKSGEYVFLQKHDSSERGTSASAIKDIFREKNPGELITVDDIKHIAAHFGIIGDERYGLWSKGATEAHGEIRPHWRFTRLGEEAIYNFLDHYMAQAEPLITGGTCKKRADVIGFLLAQTGKLGCGGYTTLVKPEIRPMRIVK